MQYNCNKLPGGVQWKFFLIIIGIIFFVGYCIVKFQEGVEEQKRKLGYYDKKQQEQMDELIRRMKEKDV